MKFSITLSIIAGIVLGFYIHTAFADTLCMPICYEVGGQQVCNVLCS